MRIKMELHGKKTYIVSIIAIIYSIAGFLYSALDINAAFQIILAALGAAGLRHGISTLKDVK